MDNAPRVRFVSFTFLAGFGFGAFIGVMLALIAVAVARPQDETPKVIEVPVFTTSTPGPSGTAAPQVKTTAALAVRVGPGDSYATLGTMSRGDIVEVLGRDFDSKWLAIRFPPGSGSRGWIPAASVEGLADSNLRALAVLLPTPIPLVFNTPSPFFGGGSANGGGGVAGTATPIPTTSDLTIQTVRVLADGRISVTVLNRGPKHITNEIVIVVVRDLSGAGELLSYAAIFPSGESITLRTDTFRISSPTTVQVIVDPSAGIPDPNRTNNLQTVTLTPLPTPEPPATPTPNPFG